MTRKGDKFYCKNPDERIRKIRETLKKRVREGRQKGLFQKGITPKNKLPREVRSCACGCGEPFECSVHSDKKYVRVGHVNRTDKNPLRKKGRVPWNKDKTWSKSIRDSISRSRKGKCVKIDHWNWKGGKCKYAVLRNEWDIIRYRVYLRDKFTCQYCGKKKVVLNAHHIILYRFSKSNDLNILISLCRKCHPKLEKKMTILYRQSAGKISDEIVGKILRDYTLEDSRIARIYDIVRTANIKKIAEVGRNSNPPIEK